MSDKLSPLRGMKDLLPNTFYVHEHIKNTALNIGELYGYQGMATPILEAAHLFDRTLGDGSDVISKELYSFFDKKSRLIALRPEFTASIMRSVISNGLIHKLPLKFFSTGPVFRYDRPQEGRQRQFHQLNFEHIGAKTAYSDAEMIHLALQILNKLDVADDTTLELNSLGCDESRKSYQKSLVEYLSKYHNELSVDSQKRLQKNPLRILDSKDSSDHKIIADAPVIDNYYTRDALEYFEQVKCYLDLLSIKYTINTRLVRGLDYYSHTAFEFTTKKLGAQSTILAGGRYDGLSSILGAPIIPSIGFAAGIERIALMKDFKQESIAPVFIIPINEDAMHHAINLTNLLRNKDIKTCIEYNGKISKRLQNAITNDAQFVIFIGEDEMQQDLYKIKDLVSGVENQVNIDSLMKMICYNDSFDK